jgi:fructosamine-3-kinase
MSAFSARVAELTGVPEERQERLAGGDLSEVLMLRRPDGRCTVAKGGPAVAVEAAMLRMLAAAGTPVPTVEGEYEGVLLIGHVSNDGIFSPSAWTDVGAVLRALHARTGDDFGWPADYRLGTVELVNRPTGDWPSFWSQRLTSTASVLDRPWRERVAALSDQLPDLLPAQPIPSLLHGDLWSGNILVSGGKLAALIDPACSYGHAEVDLAMLTLFGEPPDEFWSSYGEPEPGWERRRPIYQLFPALVHLRLFGGPYAGMVDRLLSSHQC